MQIDLSPAAVDTLVHEKKHLIEREARRFWGRFFLQTGVVSYEDVLQEAYQGFLVTLRYFNKSKSPMAALDPYIVLGIKGELSNWVQRMNRQFNYTYDDPEVINSIPEPIRGLMPTIEDLEILTPLSKQATEFLSCIFIPPTKLEHRIKKKVTSGKPYAKSILPLILEWLSIGYDDYNVIRAELKSKCVYTPLEVVPQR